MSGKIEMVSQRRDKRIWYVVLGLFICVSFFSFLVQKYKASSEVDAASLAGFDPGYIISDYQMGRYNSMSEAEIQAFLTAKNPCGNRDYNYYLRLSAGSSYTWHWDNGHFVCLSEERFGDGEVIGSGDTAAHIIWQTAQDYKINPQVLIVLLQKETGLITDPIPNSGDYRKATGYGCPDTAPCSSQYYGFKNQVRKAAALFRAVLDGGWTNYPLGNNYIQYNPDSGCGGSVVNVRSLATSALYRYTPYQPNAGALAAGYGTAYCGAYGNRNFYLYFEDWFGGVTSDVKSIKIAEGDYYIRSVLDFNKVVDVDAAGDANGTNVQVFQRNNTVAQQWTIKYNSSTDDYTVINVGSGKALDVSAASVENGANVQIWEKNDTCAQRWKIIDNDNGSVKLLSSCSWKAFNIQYNNAVDGANMEIWVSGGNKAQSWDLMPVDEADEGLYTIVSAIDSGKTIDISGGSHNANNGANVQLWNGNYTAAQQWYLSKDKDGYYIIKNLQSNKVVDVSAARKENGTNIQIWESNNTCAQKWKILKRNQYYEFISVCSNKALDLSAANSRAGTNIQLYDANNSMAQKWILKEIHTVKDGEYVVASKLSENKTMDVSGNKSDSGTNVQLYEYNGTSAQKWTIIYDKKDGYYSVYNEGVNKALDVAEAGRNNGSNVQMWNKNKTCAQKWLVTEIDGGYTLYSACSGLALDVAGAKKDNGTNIQIYEPNGTLAQKWMLKPTSEL